MKRLRDELRSSDPEVARLAHLVSSARPPADSGEMKARVRRAVARRLEAPAARPRWLRPSYAAAGLLLLSSAAAASVTWVVVSLVRAPTTAPVEEGSKAPALPAAHDEAAPARRAHAEDRAPRIELGALLATADEPVGDAETPVLQPSAALPALPPRPVSEPEADEVDAPRIFAPPVPVEAEEAPEPERPAPLSAAPALDPDVELLRQAFQALRREADATRAIPLLQQHLSRYGESPLREEALGLLIDAYAAVGDPRAAVQANRYIREFPDGRFRGAAERALRRFAP